MTRLEFVERLEATLEPYRWAWAEENRDRIAAHWAFRKRERPAIFNGRCLMLSSLEIARGVCRARFFTTDYADLLAWNDLRPRDPSVRNGYAMGALRGRDGGFVLTRMGAHTANAGRVYFPCGTPDLDDVDNDAAVDLAGSLVREIAEETGLGPDDLDVDPRWTVVEAGGFVAFMRLVRLRMDAETARARVLRFIASQPEPELADALVVRGPGEIDPAPMPPTVPLYLRNAFAGGPADQG